MSQGVREERLVTRVTGFRLHMTSRISHCMYLHFFWVCNNLRLQNICTKIGSLNKCRLVVFVFPHSLCDSNELWHFHLNLNLGCVCVCVLLSCFSYVWVFAALWTADCQAPLSTRFHRQYQNGLLCFSPGDLPDPGIEPASATSRFFTHWASWEAPILANTYQANFCEL